MSRYVRFNGVGIAGFAVQWVVLAALMRGLDMHYLPASLIAVEFAVLHNFVWHERWTWRDRPHAGRRGSRLFRFHAANGLTSLLGHAAGMPLLVQVCGISPFLANVMLVLTMSILNYRLSDRMVWSQVNTRSEQFGRILPAHVEKSLHSGKDRRTHMKAHQLTGLCCAAALACSINVSAQTSGQQGSSSDQQGSSSAPATAQESQSGVSTDTTATASRADKDGRIVTIVGCVQSASAALGSAGIGQGNEFVLTNATMGTADSASAAPSSQSSTVGTSGTEPTTGASKPDADAKGTEPDSERAEASSAGTGAVGTSGAASSGSASAIYSLTGSREGEMARFVGKRVEITGKLEHERSAPGATSGTPSGQDRDAASTSSTPESGTAGSSGSTTGTSGTVTGSSSTTGAAAIPQVDITRYREIGGSCDATGR